MEGYALEKIPHHTLIIGCVTAANCQVQPIRRALLCEAQNKVLHNYTYDRAGAGYLSSPSLINNINFQL